MPIPNRHPPPTFIRRLRRLPLLFLCVSPPALAQVVSLPVHDCSSAPPSTRITISSVYAQADPQEHVLRFTLLGSSPAPISFSSNTTNPLLSTVFAPASVLTFPLNLGAESHAFCDSLRPPSPLTPLANDSTTGYCPFPPGPLAFAVTTPLARHFELMTVNTQVHVLDTSVPAQELACVLIPATLLRPGIAHSVYGHAVLIFWFSVALAIAFWLVIGVGRLAAARKRGRQRVESDLWSHIQGLGFVLASAISGERFSSSPALLRFGTPSMRDVIFHSQWCTLLAMITVQWPPFVYPYIAQTAWASLLYNVSFTGTQHWDSLHSAQFNPPPEFADQIADPTSPLFLNASIPNTLFTLPSHESQTGIPALTSTIGIRPQDAFNIVAGLFIVILAGTVVLSIVIYAFDWFICTLVRATTATRAPQWASSHKVLGESVEPVVPDEALGAGNIHFTSGSPSRTLPNIPAPRGWLNYRLGRSSFHGSVLHGNLVRILILFHLPVTIFSCYHFTSHVSHSSLVTVILAAFTFAIFSISIPIWLLLRVFTTPTSKLYDETRTLLALGPLYNHYAHGSQLFASLFFASNIVYGLTLGCGQHSGTAQSIVILMTEVVSALTTSVWFPWGRGATMGGISFVLCVIRIITAVLLVTLSPAVSVGDAAGGWIAYAILVIQGLVYLGFALMLISKLVEGAVRLAWKVSFDRSKHTVDSGLIGAIALAGCVGPRRKGRPSRIAQTRMSHPSESDSMTTQKRLLPTFPQATETSRSPASAPPSSVLRPEQLNQPYREESDDEGGHILGAWHYDDEPLTPQDATEPGRGGEPAPMPGFSRIGGGRANIESPYTVTSGTGGARGQIGVLGTSHHGVFPPRATAPNQSASAIIADADLRAGIDSAPVETADGEATRRSARTRRMWFAALLGRRPPRREDPPEEVEVGGGDHTFVVIRDR